MKQSFSLIINGAQYEWPTKNITGSDLRKLAGIDADSTLYYKIQGIDDEVHDTETIDLGRIGIEHFYSRPNDPTFKFNLNGESYSWKSRYITGIQLRQLGSIHEDEYLYLKEEQNDLLIQNDMRVDLAPHGVEEFYSKKINHLVHITVTVKGVAKTVEITKGNHSVIEIKEKGGVPQAFELEQKVNGRLIPLKNDAIIDIKGGEEFIGHVCDGSSS